MATTPIGPRANNEGSIGLKDIQWAEGYFAKFILNGIESVSGNYIQTAGTLTAYTLAKANFVRATGARVLVRFHVSNGASATLNVNSTGAAQIRFVSGTALTAGEIPINSILELSFDGTYWIIENSNAATVGGQTAAQLIAAAQAGVAAGNTVAVLTGTTAPTGEGNVTYIMPLPSGFTEAQCKFFGVITVYATSIGAATTRPTLFVVSRTTTVNAGYTLYYIVIGVK